MGEKQTPGDAKVISAQMSEAHERLHALDAKDRRHWTATIVVLVTLAIALLALTFPGVATLIFSDKTVILLVRLLLVCVVVFGFLALQRQRVFAARRFEAALEIAIITASETLRGGNGKPEREADRRSSVRICCNQRLTVRTHNSEGLEVYYGRVLDICEHGLGAIVPSMMETGQEVLLEFSLIDSSRTPSAPLKVSAIVRQRSGFRYGFNFVALTEADREQIESYRGADRVVSIVGRGASATD